MDKKLVSLVRTACRKALAPVGIAAAAVVASPAFAAYDITAATAAMTDAGTAASTVLAAAIGFAGLVVGGILLFRMIRRIG